jgi:AcrR family transcriptional regulator
MCIGSGICQHLLTCMSAPATPASNKSERTRAAILDAARSLFAERGYARATIRDVAAAAAIDPAMVIRYFGSKDELFVRAAAFELRLPALDRVPRRAVGETLARHFVALWEGPAANPGMAVLLRSAAANETSAATVRAIFATEVCAALARVGPRKTAGCRAALVASQLLGVALCRYVLRLPFLADMPADELIAHIAPTLQRYAVG